MIILHQNHFHFGSVRDCSSHFSLPLPYLLVVWSSNLENLSNLEMAADPATTRVCFAVDVEDVDPSSFVLVTGSTASLGQWDPLKAMTLTQDADRPTRWRGFVDTTDDEVRFRYFIGYFLSSEQGQRLIIDRWESFLNPRCCVIKAEHKGTTRRANHVDLFGYFAGHKVLSEGWLQYDDENQILLRLHGNALKFYKSAKERKNCTVRINPMDVRQRLRGGAHISFSYGVDEEDDEDDANALPYPSHSSISVAVLSDKNPKFRPQPDVGITFNNNKDYVVYKTHSVAVEFLAFYIEIFSEEGKRIGACYALPSSLTDSCGLSQLPFINSSGRPIGQITVEYLFVRNLRRPVPTQNMEVSYSRHWKKRNTIEVGHRGAGNSYTKFAAARENTIFSLNTAAKNGADYVEFDVQLTKDKVAVIYHDFHVLVSVAKRHPPLPEILHPADVHSEKLIEFYEIPVKDLKLSQLKLLMLDHVNYRQMKEKVKKLVEDGEEEEDFKPFPTLIEALTKVDPDVGFNVEIKYPMMQINGEHECDHYFERNEFIDVILADLLNNAGNRRIMFSSFDPDICSLISMKQNKYPVLFLCVGETQRYTRFQDQRTSTSLTAVNFAAGADIMGVNFNSEDLLNDPYPVKRANDFRLITFVWGDDLDKKENINYFKKELGVDGLIYDRIGEDERRRNVFIVEREQKRALFKISSGNNTPQRTISPLGSNSSRSSLDDASLIHDHEHEALKSYKEIPEISNDVALNRIDVSPKVQVTRS
ncbi:unnamed protein product [Cylicocyclus nassatus]|uniref:Glycerophosphocholine phosphodiesterase n=1 Tax=Cylicocyclus nassatus TaxID=53992 RepID=A0AA36MBE4_CYLNA|nr:unnamed protein product [Cylicocyclus nassatus]